MSPTVPLFVYGTLREGERFHAMLARCAPLGSRRTAARYRLVDLGHYPAMLMPGDASVIGELYGVDDHTLRALDTLEAHPHHFQRARIELEGGETAEAYLLPPDRCPACLDIPSGDWLRR